MSDFEAFLGHSISQNIPKFVRLIYNLSGRVFASLIQIKQAFQRSRHTLQTLLSRIIRQW